MAVGFGFLVAIAILEPALRILGIGYPNLYEHDPFCRTHHTSVFLVNVSSSLQAWPDPAFRKRVASTCEVEDVFESENRLRRVCEMADLPFYALASAMQQEAERSSVFLHGFSNTAKGVGHWNQQGNAVAAKLVAEWLLQQDSMLPK